MSNHNTVAPCRYNTCVDCPTRDKGLNKCPTCGWNPEEQERRAASLDANLREKDFDLIRADGAAEVRKVRYLKLNH